MARLVNIFARVNEQLGVWFMRTLAVSLLILLFFVSGGGISQNDQWRISEIRITGANVVASDEIKARVGENLLGNYYFVYSRGNSYLFPRREIETALLKTFPRLSTATVRRVSNKTITIEITERKPFGLWCGEEYNKEMYELNDCWFIDDTGFVFDRAPTFSEGVYLEVYGGIDGLKNGDALRTAIIHERFVFAHAFQNAIRKDIGTPLRIIMKPDGEYGVTIQTSHTYPVLIGVELQFKDKQDLDILVQNIISALHEQFPEDASRPVDLLDTISQEVSRLTDLHDTIPQNRKRKLQYIDLRFNKRVIFGFEI